MTMDLIMTIFRNFKAVISLNMSMGQFWLCMITPFILRLRAF